jgi:hypothetical protein
MSGATVVITERRLSALFNLSLLSGVDGEVQGSVDYEDPTSTSAFFLKSSGNCDDLPWLNSAECAKIIRNQLPQGGETIRSGTQNDDRDPANAQVLLERNFLVGSDHDVKACSFGSPQ